MRVRISPAGGYAHGHIETLLIQLGIAPPSPRDPDGIVVMELTQAQLDAFSLRGGAHRVEILPELPAPIVLPPETAVAPVPPVSAVPPVPLAPAERRQTKKRLAEFPVSTLEELMKEGIPKVKARKIIWQQQQIADLLAQGKEDEARVLIQSIKH